MKILFQNSAVEKLCSDQRAAVKELGAESAKKLQRRLAELFAASVVTDLAVGRPHPLQHDRAGQFAVDLHKGWRLIFKATKNPPPMNRDGVTDWSQVSDITIIEVEDYHG